MSASFSLALLVRRSRPLSLSLSSLTLFSHSLLSIPVLGSRFLTLIFSPSLLLSILLLYVVCFDLLVRRSSSRARSLSSLHPSAVRGFGLCSVLNTVCVLSGVYKMTEGTAVAAAGETQSKRPCTASPLPSASDSSSSSSNVPWVLRAFGRGHVATSS